MPAATIVVARAFVINPTRDVAEVAPMGGGS